MSDKTDGALPPRGYGAPIFLAAMGLALATTSGAILSAAGQGDLQQAVRIMGFTRGAELETAQRQQAAELSRLDGQLRVVISALATLNSGSTGARNDTAVGDHLARLDADLGKLRAETARLQTATAELRTAQDAMAAAEPWRPQVEELKAALTLAGIETGALRSSLDAGDHTRRREMVEMGRRVDRLERLATAETTSSAPQPRRHSLHSGRRPSLPHGRASRATRERHSSGTNGTGQASAYEVVYADTAQQHGWAAAPSRETSAQQ